MIGVSYDDLTTLVEFQSAYGITFPLIADQDRSIRDTYDTGRVTYLIDKQGVIRHVQQGVPRNKDFLQILETL